MPEQGNISLSSPDALHDADNSGQRESIGSDLHIRALASPFKKTQMVEHDGGLLIKGVPMLASGTWTDSAIGSPLNYPDTTLREFATNWSDTTGWSRHLGGVPRDVTDKVAEILNPRYEDNAVTGDIFVHGATQKSRDLMEMVKRKLISYVSVEHTGDERYNPDTRQLEATSLDFRGFAFVHKGACKLCRINEEPKKPVPAPMTEPVEDQSMDTKELETQVAELTRKLAELTAQPPVKVAEPVVVVDHSQEIAELKAQVKELMSRPAPVTTQPIEQPKELKEPETVVRIDRNAREIYGV
jgi:hypothetical protein